MRQLIFSSIVFLSVPVLAYCDQSPRLPQADPSAVGMEIAKLAKIDDVVARAIQRGDLPGAVVVVIRQGKVIWRKAYGHRSTKPVPIVMTMDTVFDMASLTKPIATATSIMLLVEQGKLRLSDPVSKYLPAFDAERKHQITIEQLLLHTSGLIPDNALADYQDGKEKAIQRLMQQQPRSSPGSKFVYSDVGYMLLGLIVEKVSGQPLDQFAHENIFAPLELMETTFTPDEKIGRRAAPTEQRYGKWMQGEVHDPRAYLLGGVAGHAGLFSTADDLAVYAQMLLNDGTFAGKRILSPLTARLMTEPRKVPGGLRTFGWDAATSYSSNRGELFPAGGGFGHTGFTGTSLWVDRGSQTIVIVLSNRVHPSGKGNVVRLRSQIATLVAASIVQPPFPQTPGKDQQEHQHAQVLTGIDVLKRDAFQPLQGKRIGLVTNHTGIDRDGRSTIDLLYDAPNVKLVALFSPEHGIRGEVDKLVDDSKDAKTGLPVYSLYGKRKRPTAEQLESVDVLVFDIQDIGCRFYTYISTLGYILETAAEHNKQVFVLDRPNPIGGTVIEGPILEKRFESFVGYHPLPVRHGMTVGELANLFNKERKIGADLHIIRMEGWKRGQMFDQTGLLWVNPSPNMRSLEEALLYPGIGLLETTNISVGRGTDRPFEILGAPWLDGRKLAAELAKANLPGIRFVPVQFTPKSSTHAGKLCGGVHLFVDDWQSFSPLQTGITLASALAKLYPKQWTSDRYLRLLGHRPTLEKLQQGEQPAVILDSWRKDLAEFEQLRKKYLLY